MSDELIEFSAEAPADAPARVRQGWKVLIVDDDEDVHRSTELGLAGVEVVGRPLQFLHAYSAAEARECFAHETDLAVILLDVVMETQDAGLALVDEVRNRYGLHEARIILRTGQPGYAPELEAIRDYDINDYKNKSELSRGRLFAALTAAIRTYQQLHIINAGRAGLAKIVHGSAALLRTEGLAEFAAGVITQIAGLLGLQPEGLVCARSDGDDGAVVVAAAGRFQPAIGRALDTLQEASVRVMLERALRERAAVSGEGRGMALYFGGQGGRSLAAWVDAGCADENSLDPGLLEVFCTNVAMCLDNAGLVERLSAYSYYDQLLHLPNRRHLVEQLDACLARGAGRRGLLAVLDIDHFGEINGAFGHRYGDRLLNAAALRLVGGCPDALVARVGSDIFAVLWREAPPPADGLRYLFDEALTVDGEPITVSVTGGTVALADVAGDGNEALEAAFLALKHAKQGMRGSLAAYSAQMGDAIRDRVHLLNRLREAFATEQLFLAFQPQVDLASGRCVGAEALLRWRTAEGEMIPPDRFIPLAEQSGLIVALGEWVMRQACREAVALAARGRGDLRIAVNVSLTQFRDPRFIDRLRAVLAETGASPAQIELEITESVAMGEGARIVELFGRIREMGLELAIDDFGTGYSSLSQLQRMNVDRLKIDRAFVQALGQEARGSEIAALVCGLGGRLGIELIAEGIEEAAQQAHLHEMGCQLGQGYLFARPMPAAEWHAWLDAHGDAAGR
ncbi:EAL domain-containing protein [Thauera sp. CAU 1555]|uniref:EAL domain-containing protein n=1 Tax=Thauera sedimentorum TaxID=2767595 RepID=A0ABR9BDW0_9RHOO|nr:EAL domain-containing protein [Thauera sedimentorum]MBC9073609.1 EAL domain-containing protein [Thauera sedimentorum]MBD8504528.1 EAL domain-containing protein [Thauera sedimentorum]